MLVCVIWQGWFMHATPIYILYQLHAKRVVHLRQWIKGHWGYQELKYNKDERTNSKSHKGRNVPVGGLMPSLSLSPTEGSQHIMVTPVNPHQLPWNRSFMTLSKEM